METASLPGVDANNIIRRDWATFESFVDYVRHPGQVEQHLSTTGMDANWYGGTETYEDALAIADHGWPEGLAKIERLRGGLRKLETEMTDRHIARFDECGDEVEVGRYVTNEPECMIDWDVMQVPASGRVVKLVCNMSASCGVSAEHMFLRGAAAVALADLIEQAGLRTEIVMAASGTRGGYGTFITVNVKRADQPLELDRLAFMLSHAAVFRRFVFRAWERMMTQDQFDQHLGSGDAYGIPQTVQIKGDGVIMVEALQWGFGNHIESTEQAIAFVNKMVDSIIEREPQPV